MKEEPTHLGHLDDESDGRVGVVLFVVLNLGSDLVGAVRQNLHHLGETVTETSLNVE